MSYVSRLIQDTGLSFDNPVVPTISELGAPGGSDSGALLETEDTVVVSPRDSSFPASSQTASAAVSEPVPETGALETRTDREVPRALQAVEPHSDPVLRTLPVAHEQTSTATTRRNMPDPVTVRPPRFAFSADVEATADADADAPVLDAVPVTLLERHIVPPSVRPSEDSKLVGPVSDTETSEVMHVSVSVGSIELTVEAPPPAAASPRQVAPAARPRDTIPDSTAILRRHYYRQPIG